MTWVKPGTIHTGPSTDTTPAPAVGAGILTDDEIAGMRDTVSDSLGDQCDVLAMITQVDGEGGQTATWVIVARYGCRVVSEATQTEIVDGGKTTASTMYQVYLPFNAVIDASNRLSVNGSIYEVEGRLQGTSYNLQTVIRCQLVE